ncbi:MAG: cell division protein FtsZ [Verrucomicrobia bacterium]|nr:cell division protein FtsZ [Verrucomicrobiota bacterium]
MSDSAETNAAGKSPARFTIKVIGVGGAGGNAVEHMASAGLEGLAFAAINTDAQALSQLTVGKKMQLGEKTTRGLGAGGDPDVGRAAAEADAAALKKLCAGADIIFIVTGLGGGTGTGASPVLARTAKETGALVLGLATLPFEFEGARRHQQAQQGLEQLKGAADGVICLPNQKILKFVDERATVEETFRVANELLSHGVRGIARMLTRAGLINVDFADLCAVLRGRHAESACAVAEAAGPHRAREVVEKLTASPLLDAGQALAGAGALLVSIEGGPDMSMADVTHVMDHLNRQCDNVQIKFAAAVDASLAGRLSVTVIASRRHARVDAVAADKLETTFLTPAEAARPAARLVPPPPELTAERAGQLLQQHGGGGRTRPRAGKPQQAQLPLEIISKGRFDKSEPTLHQGEDLDYPTYSRRGMALN